MYLLAPLVLTLALSGALYKTKEVWSQVQFKGQTEGAAQGYDASRFFAPPVSRLFDKQGGGEAYFARERVSQLGWNPGEMHVGAFQYGPKGQGRTLQNPMRAEI